jgi:hypothetical protein
MSDEVEPMNHPPAWALDAVAAGDAPGGFEPHLASCAACVAYVTALREEAEAFRARAKPQAFAAVVRARASGRPASRFAPRGAWLAASVLAAAIALVVWPSRAPAPVTDGTVSSEHFKGGMTLAVIRERAGLQERLTGPFEVQPGDRIRLEVAVDHDRPVSGGLLSDTGAWSSLLSPVPLGAGTHYSELAARFDDDPTGAFLIVGAPSDVDRARATRNFADVLAWRVTSAPGR